MKLLKDYYGLLDRNQRFSILLNIVCTLAIAASLVETAPFSVLPLIAVAFSSSVTWYFVGKHIWTKMAIEVCSQTTQEAIDVAEQALKEVHKRGELCDQFVELGKTTLELGFIAAKRFTVSRQHLSLALGQHPAIIKALREYYSMAELSTSSDDQQSDKTQETTDSDAAVGPLTFEQIIAKYGGDLSQPSPAHLVESPENLQLAIANLRANLIDSDRLADLQTRLDDLKTRGLTTPRRGRPRGSLSSGALSAGTTIDDMLPFLRQARSARDNQDGSFTRLCNDRGIPESTVRAWLDNYADKIAQEM